MNEFWWGVVITLIVGIPVAYGIALLAHLHAPRLAHLLETRKLLKKHKTRQQALVVFNRIKDFREGKRDRYPFYMVLMGAAIISAILASTLLLIISIQVHEYPISIEYGIVALFAVIAILFAIIFLTTIYETARQLERFDDYKAEFEEKWGPVDDDPEERVRQISMKN
jgi:uncharacterized membrane protein YhaH (DUF805 family)